VNENPANSALAAVGEIPGDAVRSRIIEATFCLLMEQGYAGASTREIARRARVSKRELYALFDSKEGILAAMIGGRAARMRQPLAFPEVQDRAALRAVLTKFGESLLREGSNPAVLAIMRLAVAETERSPDLARRLDADGRRPTRAALVALLAQARANGLFGDGDIEVEAMAARFLALLWSDLQLGLLLRVAEQPTADAITQRATGAVEGFFALYPAPLRSAG
jgi:AcrR family transcriptional regulator